MAVHGRLYWAERTANRRRASYPAFRGECEADAVVIGGGLVGSLAAHVFARAGMEVVLLEAGRLASGATAAGLGAIVPQPDASFRAVEAAAGRRVARMAWISAKRSARELASTLRGLHISCNLTPAPLIINARSAGDETRLRREQAARKAAGLDAPWLARAAARTAAGTDSFGAIRLRDGFVFDPVRATLGLAGAAVADGASVFERSEVRRTRFTRRFADVILASGRIRTRHVFVATGGPGPLFGQLRRHVREQTGYVVVSEPLTAPMRRETGSRDSVITEADGAPRWLRWVSDDRALFAGRLSKLVGARQMERAVAGSAAELMYELSVRYPAISGLPRRWGWSTPVVTTADGLPWIGSHRNYPFHFFALAFGWHADGLAWLAAKAALRHCQGESTKADAAFGFLR